MASHLNNSIVSIWRLCLFSCRTGRVNKQTVDGATLNGAKHGVRHRAEQGNMPNGWTKGWAKGGQTFQSSLLATHLPPFAVAPKTPVSIHLTLNM